MKTIKANPSADVIGMILKSPTEIQLSYRKGVNNILMAAEVEVLNANATGRRLELTFRGSNGKTVGTRRVYREHFVKMADKFGVDIDD